VADLLPDSRLTQRPDLGATVVDWQMPGGGSVRVEVVPIYCAACGKMYGYVPRENTAFAFYLCRKCSENWSPLPGTFVQPDDDFCRAVAEEMVARFGRPLTDAELAAAAGAGGLGRALELLAKESPYPSADRRPEGVP
jgi:hypothetical protein